LLSILDRGELLLRKTAEVAIHALDTDAAHLVQQDYRAAAKAAGTLRQAWIQSW